MSKMKTLSAALLAAGVTVVGTAGAFSLTPSWHKPAPQVAVTPPSEAQAT